MSLREFDLLDVVESAGLACRQQAYDNEHAVIGYMEPQLARLWIGDDTAIQRALVGLTHAVMQVERGLDVCIRATNGDVFIDDSIGRVPIRFSIHYTYVGPEPAGVYNERKYIEASLGADLEFGIERGKGSFLSFIVTLQPCDRQLERPLLIDRLNNIPMFVLSNEPPPNRAIHGNLRYWGLRCDGAPTFQEGILEISRQASLDDPYQLIIVSQPIEDGTAADVAREIKGSGLHNTKLIHIDRFFDHTNKEESIKAGFDAYMSKPFKTSELLKAISEQLGINLSADEVSVLPSVLVVDDNLTNQKLAMFQLRRLGITPDITANGKEALEALSRKKYSMVLLDIEMPVMNGYETLQRIRQIRHLSALPVVMVTANETGNARDRCMKSGATAFLTKPVRMETIAQLIKQYCGYHGQHEQAQAS